MVLCSNIGMLGRFAEIITRPSAWTNGPAACQHNDVTISIIWLSFSV